MMKRTIKIISIFLIVCLTACQKTTNKTDAQIYFENNNFEVCYFIDFFRNTPNFEISNSIQIIHGFIDETNVENVNIWFVMDNRRRSCAISNNFNLGIWTPEADLEDCKIERDRFLEESVIEEEDFLEYIRYLYQEYLDGNVDLCVRS